MNQSQSILAPVFALAAWTACMLLLMAYRRIQASLSGQLHPQDFAFGESAAVPPSVALVNRNYMNLLEFPVLFYVVCLVVVLTGASSPSILAFAWAYVGLRVMHSVIHITYNRVLHRLTAFALSNVVLMALWIVVGLRAFRG